jgi:hypothetical protein
MTTLNPYLLERTMALIKREPHCWDQNTLGVTTARGQVIADFPGWVVMTAEPTQQPPYGYRDTDGVWVPETHWLVHGIWAPSYAAKLLGIGVLQRKVFFHNRWRRLASLRAGVDALITSAGDINPHRLETTMRDV